jgi:hypothetical protein
MGYQKKGYMSGEIGVAWLHQEKIHLLENGLKVLKMAF